jgi:hypothetical protein
MKSEDEIRDAVDKVIARCDQLHRIEGIAKKLVLCFPEDIPEGEEEVSFNIPAYIVRDLRQELTSAV